MQRVIEQLDPYLECDDCIVDDKHVVFKVTSTQTTLHCPHCGVESKKVNSTNYRKIKDLPIEGKPTIIMLMARNMVCANPDCPHRFFVERFDFIQYHCQMTKRLAEKNMGEGKGKGIGNYGT
ncbi:MAG: transposase family protein [Lachnospiraceae bacterium]|jgi:transposase|nr:transposase family protein [Lachnospiraceae bacterium]